MLGIPSGVKIFAYMEACDMRKQFDGLAGLVRQGMGRNPQSGDMYVFGARTWSKFCFLTSRAFVCLRSGWNAIHSNYFVLAVRTVWR
jgi:IS66 Orf2 like protein